MSSSVTIQPWVKGIALLIFLSAVSLMIAAMAFMHDDSRASRIVQFALIVTGAGALPSLQVIGSKKWPTAEQRKKNRIGGLKWSLLGFAFAGTGMFIAVAMHEAPSGEAGGDDGKAMAVVMLFAIGAALMILLGLSTVVTGLPYAAVFNAISRNTVNNASGEIHKIPGLNVAPQIDSDGKGSFFQHAIAEDMNDNSKPVPTTPAHEPAIVLTRETPSQFFARLEKVHGRNDDDPRREDADS